jgi:SpoIID/LytB domain protein
LASPKRTNGSRRRRLRVLLACTALFAGALVGPVAVPPRPAVAEPSFDFSGNGNGHGVGLSQYGAHGMAAQGYSATQILQHYYAGTTVQSMPQPGSLRVLVARSANAIVAPTGPTQFVFNGQVVASAAAGQNVTVTASGNNFVIQGRTGPFGNPGDLLLVPLAPTQPIALFPDNPAWPTHRYGRGVLVFRVTAPGALQMTIEVLGMEDYLRGIGEMPSSWEPAALQAQAIAARTFAKNVTEARRANPARSYDLDASADGAYIGWDKEAGTSADRWIAAVDSTTSQTVTYQGAAIQAFFSASDGGYTENSEYVFAQALPYLRGAPDPFDSYTNPFASWSRSYGQTELSSAFARFSDTSVGTLTNISILGPLGVSGRIDKATVRLTGTAATKDISGSRLRSVINATFGGSRNFPSTKVALAGDPFGRIDAVTRTPQGLRLAGWAIDPNTADPVTIRIDVAGTSTSIVANSSRPDVAGAYPSYGANHGFDTTLPLPAGTHALCATMIDIGPGTDEALGCWSVTTDPIGNLDAFARVPGGFHVSGWALDLDTTAALTMTAAAGPQSTPFVASAPRPDVGAAYPGYGDQHGFDVTVPAPAGTYTFCVAGTNVGIGSNANIGCRDVTVSNAPTGSLDAVSDAGVGRIAAAGWGMDPDTADPIDMHIYVDGVRAAVLTASTSRPDIAAAFPGYGDQHGFATTLTVGGGTHQVCAWGLNRGAGNVNILFGCRTITLPADPIGALDAMQRVPGGLQLAGWALDPDTADSINVRAAIGSAATTFAANLSRADIAAAYPAYGGAHGFGSTVAVPEGSYPVCVTAVDVGPGADGRLACRTVTVSYAPFGNIDVVRDAGTGTLSVAGWALDPDSAGPVDVHVYVDGLRTRVVSARDDRPDVAAAFPGYGSEHGFAATIAAGPGTHQVCAWAVNAGAGNVNIMFGCRNVTLG